MKELSLIDNFIVNLTRIYYYLTIVVVIRNNLKMSKTYMCEPDIIAANENVMPDLNNDLVMAKNFLKQQCAATGDTLQVLQNS